MAPDRLLLGISTRPSVTAIPSSVARVRIHLPYHASRALLVVLVALLFPAASLAQTITITSINGEAVPPADEVYVPASFFPVIEVGWQASTTPITISVFLDDGTAVPCDGNCGGMGSSGTFTVDQPAGGCRHTIQIQGTFVPGGNKNSQVLGFWSTAYKACTGPEDCSDGMGSVGAPIDVATGKMYHQVTDFVIRGPLPIEFARRYDSQSTFNGPLGFGWRHNYLMKLEFPSSAQRVFVDGQGRRIYFAKRLGNTWDENRIDHLVLTQPGTPAWRVTDKHQTKYEFDSNGVLTRIADRNNNQLTFGYSAGDLTSITDSFDRTVMLAYTSGRIATISAGGRTVSYDYSGDDLAFVDYPDDSSLTYQYDPPAGPHNLTTVLDELGHVVEDHDYDGSDRVIHFQQEGGVGELTISYDSPTQTTVTNSLGIPTVYTHDEFSGLVTASTGPGCASCGTGGASAILSYDQFLNLKEVIDGRGTHTMMQYDAKGNVTMRKEAVGTLLERTWAFTYHPTFNFLTSSSIPSVGTCGNPNRVETTIYDATGDPNQRQILGCNGATPFSFTTGFSYDARGRLLSVDGPRTDVTDVTTYAYYDDDPNTELDAGRRGRLMSITNALSHLGTYNDYDLFGNVGSIVQNPNVPGSRVETTFLYDTRDRLLQRSILGDTPADDIVTINEYDDAGNLDLVRLPNCVEAGPSCVFSLDYGYDGANRLTEIRDPFGNRIVYAYDTESNRTREEFLDPTNAIQRFTNFGYDSLNRLQYIYFNDIVPIEPEDPNAIFWKLTYDDSGNRVAEQDPEGHVTSYTYDELNRLATATRPVGVDVLITEYGYDVQDNLESVTDPADLATSYVRSDMGWQLQVVSPDTGTTTYTYDPAGNQLTSLNNRGIFVSRTYDALDRPVTVSYPDSSLDVTPSYDSTLVSFGIGRRTGLTDSSGATVYHYDRRGLRTMEQKTIDSVTFTTQYLHDKTGNETQILYPTSDPNQRQGLAVFTFDAADRITDVTAAVNGAMPSVASGITYKPFGSPTSMTFSNGRTDARMYDSRYRLGGWTLSGLLSYTHSHDDDDNLTARLDNLNAANDRGFGYDEVHRLTNASGPWGAGTSCTLSSSTYEYDLNGNRTCKGEGATSTTYLYVAGSNHLDETTGAESAMYSHDLGGNVTGDGTHTYVFDNSDRLATVDAGATATYLYDGDGRRAIKTAAGETTYYFYHPDGRLLSEMVPADESGKDYIYLEQSPLARVDWAAQELSLEDVLTAADSSPNVHLDWTAFPAGSNRYVVRRKQIIDFSDKTFDGNVVIATPEDPVQSFDDPVLGDTNTYFYRVFRESLTDTLYIYHADHLGTPIAMTDGTGALVWRAEHLPFGGIHSLPVSTVTNNLGFPGQYFDTETGLHQNWFRDYDPLVAQYREPDPLAQTVPLHPYSYVSGNPLRWVDVLGLFQRGDVLFRVHPVTGQQADVVFVWRDESPDDDAIDENLWILAFGNPQRCPETCSGKATPTRINSMTDPYRGYPISGSYKPFWFARADDAEYERRWHEWRQENPTWTPPFVEPAFQCYTLVNRMTGIGEAGPFEEFLFGPRNLSFWRRVTE